MYACAFAFFISAHCLWRDFYGEAAKYCLDLVEQDKDGKKIRNAACKICADTTLTYTGGTSNLMHHLEAKHPNEYCKAKNEESDETDKPMEQTSLLVCPSIKSVL